MKAFTDIKQSKKLAEFLPLESADMKYPYFGYGRYGTTAYFGEPIEFSGGKDISCWSLAALLELLPEGIIVNHFVPILQKENSKYSIVYGTGEMLCVADNPVDVCVEMILKLHELNLLR